MIELQIYNGKKDVLLKMEHSLQSVSKWESKHKIAFMGRLAKSPDQMIDYYQDMILSPGVDPTIVYRMSPAQMQEVNDYINEVRSASSVPQEKSKGGEEETMTSELIYYWMTELQIPFDPTDTWHLSRVLMLIQITAYKKQPPKKRKDSEVMADWRAQNERQKKLLGITS